jgi:hypothetical protein
MSFETLAEFTMPLPIAIKVYIMSTTRKIAAVLFHCTTTDSLGVCVIHDWSTRQATAINTGLPYVRIT